MDAFPFLLKRWRALRRLTQEQLAFEAQTSTRHLSCLENGKSNPSRPMVLSLARALELTLRERNTLLGSAGFAPEFPASELASPLLAPVNRAVDLLLAQQEPFGAVLLDRAWNVLRANRGAGHLLEAFLDGEGREPHIATNLVRATLHPAGLRPWIVNWPAVAALAMDRLERELAHFPLDAERAALLAEVKTYPDVGALPSAAPSPDASIAQVHLRRGQADLRVFSLLSTIGTPLDVTAQELSVELFFPVDDATTQWFVSKRASDAEGSSKA